MSGPTRPRRTDGTTWSRSSTPATTTDRTARSGTGHRSPGHPSPARGSLMSPSSFRPTIRASCRSISSGECRGLEVVDHGGQVEGDRLRIGRHRCTAIGVSPGREVAQVRGVRGEGRLRPGSRSEGPCAVTEVRRPVNRSRPQLDVGRGGRGWQLRGRLGAHNQSFSDIGVTLSLGNRARGDAV